MLSTILLAAVLPALASGLVSGLVLLAIWRRRETMGKFAASVTGAVALAGGYFLGHVLIAGRPEFPPPSATEWIAWFALMAALGGVLVTFARVSALLVVATVPWLLLAPLAKHTWTREQTTLHLTGLSFALLGLWIGLEVLSRQVSVRQLGVGLLITTLATSASLAISGSLQLGQLAGALAATVGGALAVTLFNPRLRLSGGALAVVVVIAGALMMDSHYYAFLPAPSGALLALSFLTPWFGRWPGSMTDRKRTLVHLAAAFLPAAVAVGLAIAASPDWGSGS
jgi:hypothetical protein